MWCFTTDPGLRMDFCDPIGTLPTSCADQALTETQPGVPLTICGAVKNGPSVKKLPVQFSSMISNPGGDCPVTMHSLVNSDSTTPYTSGGLTLFNHDNEDYTVHLEESSYDPASFLGAKLKFKTASG